MSKSFRIVLVDPLGDVLFSGESLSMISQAAAPTVESEERCPETLRSAMTTTHGSGVYPSMAYVDDSAPETLPENVDGTENNPASTGEIRSVRPRAA